MRVQILALLIMASAACLPGCGGSFDKDSSPELGERQANEWKSNPSSANASPESSSPRTLTPAAGPVASGQPIPGPAAQAAEKFIAATSRSAYKVGPLDVLEISVFKVPDLSKNVQVADTGTINLPLVGEIRAADRTAQDIEHDLTTQLSGKYLRNPQVTVYVREYNSQRATIEGAVKRPGVYPIKGRTSLLQFIAMAESLDRDVASGEVAIFRVINGKRHAAKYDVEEIRKGAAPDPNVEQGDVIVVDTSSSKMFFSGFVKMIPMTAAFIPLL
jgi:polysaccharide biosynthesis/export protein